MVCIQSGALSSPLTPPQALIGIQNGAAEKTLAKSRICFDTLSNLREECPIQHFSAKNTPKARFLRIQYQSVLKRQFLFFTNRASFEEDQCINRKVR